MARDVHTPAAHDKESSWSITSTAMVLVLFVTLGTWVLVVDQFLSDGSAVRRFLDRYCGGDLGRAPWVRAEASETVAALLGLLLFTGLVGGGIVLWVRLFQNGVFVGPRAVLMAFGVTSGSLVVMSVLAFRAVIMIPYGLDVLAFVGRERWLLIAGYSVVVGLVVAGAFALQKVEERRSRRRR